MATAFDKIVAAFVRPWALPLRRRCSRAQARLLTQPGLRDLASM